MNNKFFTYKDQCEKEFIFDLSHGFWFSRIYEYVWALQFANKNDICLDACTGVSHPFKFVLSDKCKKVYACDIEDLSYQNMKDSISFCFGEENVHKFTKEMYDKINFIQCSSTYIPYEEKTFDKIFCISSIEHMSGNDIMYSLRDFHRLLKDNGRLLITSDFPDMTPDKLIYFAKLEGFEIDGEYDYTLPSDAIYSDAFHDYRLYCYSMVLKKS